jgi:hypothetical protein
VITRAIHVDIRYMLWVMKEVDHADNLLKEMTIKYPGGAVRGVRGAGRARPARANLERGAREDALMSGVRGFAILGAESTGKSTCAQALARATARCGCRNTCANSSTRRARAARGRPVRHRAHPARTRDAPRPQARALPVLRHDAADDGALQPHLLGPGDAGTGWRWRPPRLRADAGDGAGPPWVPDGLMRESEEVRQRVHECLLAVLDERGIPFTAGRRGAATWRSGCGRSRLTC